VGAQRSIWVVDEKAGGRLVGADRVSRQGRIASHSRTHAFMCGRRTSPCLAFCCWRLPFPPAPNGKHKHGTRPLCRVRVRGSCGKTTHLLRGERERCER
jgi:hypothetical protein